MSTFWYTESSYSMYAAREGLDTSASVFDAAHLFYIAFCVAVCILCAVLIKRASENVRRKALIVAAAALVILEVSRIAADLLSGQWRVSSLPLQLCSVNVFVSLWYALKPSDAAGNILYSLGLPGALIAILSPSWIILPVWNFYYINSALAHLMLLCFPVMIIAGGFRPSARGLVPALAFLAVLCMVVCPINMGFGTNFLFLNDPYGNPVTAICTDIFGENLFAIGYGIILIVLLVILYAPFEISNSRRRRL